VSASSDPKNVNAPSGGLPLRWPPSITDDAGTQRRLLVLVTNDAELRQLMARLSSHLTRRLFDRNMFIGIFLILIALLIPGLVIVELLLSGAQVARYALFMGLGAILATGSIMLGRRQVIRDSGSFVATLLGMGRCGCCGYLLDELPVSGDGMSTCPECGAQWHAKRIGRPSDTDSPRLQVGTSDGGQHHLAGARREISVVFAPWSGRRTAVDARGRIIELVRDPLIRRHGAPLSALERERLEALLRAASIPRRGLNACVLMFFSLVPLLIAGMMIADMAAANSWLDVGSLVVIVAGVGFAVWMIVYAWRLLSRRSGYDTNGIIAALLAVQRCPSCGDPLPADVNTGDEAIRLCRGCGAAWPVS